MGEAAEESLAAVFNQ